MKRIIHVELVVAVLILSLFAVGNDFKVDAGNKNFARMGIFDAFSEIFGAIKKVSLNTYFYMFPKNVPKSPKPSKNDAPDVKTNEEKSYEEESIQYQDPSDKVISIENYDQNTEKIRPDDDLIVLDIKYTNKASTKTCQTFLLSYTTDSFSNVKNAKSVMSKLGISDEFNLESKYGISVVRDHDKGLAFVSSDLAVFWDDEGDCENIIQKYASLHKPITKEFVDAYKKYKSMKHKDKVPEAKRSPEGANIQKISPDMVKKLDREKIKDNQDKKKLPR